MKIRPVVAELTYTDEQTNMTKPTGSYSAIYEYAQKPPVIECLCPDSIRASPEDKTAWHCASVNITNTSKINQNFHLMKFY